MPAVDYACSKCGSGDVVVGAFVLNCAECGWHYLNDHPCTVCGKPSTSAAKSGGSTVYGCEEHSAFRQLAASGGW